MKLCASLIVRNERGRYLAECLDHLAAFCDEIRVLDDASDDGTSEYLQDFWRVMRVWGGWQRNAKPMFYAHEGLARQALLNWTLEAEPTHVLALDADEFVSDGAALRAQLEARPDLTAWTLDIDEVWTAGRTLGVREDGGWRTHPLKVVWKVPERLDPSWRIANRKLACQRVPVPVLRHSAEASGMELLHFGWADEATRAARHQRYVDADGGRFHASQHLDSIIRLDQLKLREREWPAGAVFDSLRDRFAVTA